VLFVLTLLTSHSSSILNKRHDYRHTYKIQQRKTHACNDPRIDESSSFFSSCPTLLCAISFSFFFSFAFFSLYSKINFPSSSSSSTDAPSCCYFFLFSYIFLRFQLVWTLFLPGHETAEGKKKTTKRIFFSQQILFSFIRISISNFHLKK
jgi:hypothetical protein